MSKLIFLIGIPGAGKSTFAKELVTKYDYVEVCSDGIRKELYGDEAIQDHPEKVFGIMFDRTVKNLNENKTVIYNSTNINRKLRINTLQRQNTLQGGFVWLRILRFRTFWIFTVNA